MFLGNATHEAAGRVDGSLYQWVSPLERVNKESGLQSNCFEVSGSLQRVTFNNQGLGWDVLVFYQFLTE